MAANGTLSILVKVPTKVNNENSNNGGVMPLRDEWDLKIILVKFGITKRKAIVSQRKRSPKTGSSTQGKGGNRKSRTKGERCLKIFRPTTSSSGGRGVFLGGPTGQGDPPRGRRREERQAGG